MPKRSEHNDDLDLELLRILREDGRVSLTDLAQQLRISRANAYARLGGLRRRGVIQGFSAVVDHARLGLGMTAVVLLSTGSQGRFRWRELRRGLDLLPEVEYAALVTGTADVLVLVRTASQEELRRLLLEKLQGLPHVTSTLTLTVLDEIVKRPFVLPGPGPEQR